MFKTQEKNLATLFLHRSHLYSKQDFLGYKSGEVWKWLTWSEVLQNVEMLSRALLSFHFSPGTKVGILSENRPEWVESDLAIQLMGGVTVPIYPTHTPEQIQYILHHSESKALFLSEGLLSTKLLDVLESCETLEKILLIPHEKKPSLQSKKILSWEKTLASAQKTSPKTLYECVRSIDEKQLSTIIYTSGTTADPKGVMLSHENILSNAKGNNLAIPVSTQDTALSFLPLCHAFERTACFYTLLFAGAKVAFAESIPKVSKNLLEVQPTLICCVPRILEKFYNAVCDKMSSGPAWLNWVFAKAIGDEKHPPNFFCKALAKKLIFPKIRERFGGKLQYGVSGGAALSPKIGLFMHRVGITILEGYGLTETSPVLCVNRLDRNKIGTVGIAIDQTEIKIAQDGEILAKGPGIMLGYYKDEKSTQESFTEEGYFKTGDIGSLDEDGFLTITDRKRDILVTSGGKNVAPGPWENELQTFDLVEQACMIGDGRKFISALLVPNFENLEKKALEEGLSFSDPKSLLTDAKVRSWYSHIIQRANENRASFEAVKKFELLSTPFAQETGELTPTLKLKRRVILKKYAKLIDNLYRDDK